MGLEAAPMLKEAAPHAKILLFTAFDMAHEAANEPAIDAFQRAVAVLIARTASAAQL